MNDMTAAIAPKSDQLNADDLIAGSKTINITGVSIAAGEQPVSIRYEGDAGKPYKSCKSMSRVMVHAWGPDASKYTGRSLTLYRDPEVTWGGMKVGGIRISHMSHIDKPMTMSLTAAKNSKKPFTVQPLKVGAPPAPRASDELLTAGDTAASNGVAAYTAWKDSLPADQKETIKPYHSNWAATAKANDKPKEDDIPL